MRPFHLPPINPRVPTETIILRPSNANAVTVDRLVQDALERHATTSTPSVRPLTPNTQDRLTISIDGRTFVRNANVYPFPLGENNLGFRFHRALEIIAGDIYVGPVEEVLQEEEGSEAQKAILDLGCGSGAWAMDMAHRFPHATVLGVDHVPQIQGGFPPNLRMEVDDINLGLEHFENQFDLVHARALAAGIKDYHKLVNDITAALRPGGLVLLIDTDPYFHNENGVPILPQTPTPQSRFPWIPLYAEAINRSMRNRGADPEVIYKARGWLEETDAFEEIESVDFMIPIQPWYIDPETSQEQARNEAGELFREVLDSAMLPQVISRSGLSDRMIVDMAEKSRIELRSSEGRAKTASRFHCIWARKKRVICEDSEMT